MSECNFHVGQKVVCVDAAVRFKDGTPTGQKSGLVVGQVYEIASIVIRSALYQKERQEQVCFTLVGFEPDLAWDCFAGSLSHKRFRPVVERNTDISIFKAMLNPSRSKVPA